MGADMILPLILVLVSPYAGQWIVSHMDMDGGLQIPSNQGFIEDFGAKKDATNYESNELTEMEIKDQSVDESSCMQDTEKGRNKHPKRSFGKIRILKRNGMGNIRLLRKRDGKDGRIRLLKRQNGINKLI